MCLPDVRAYNLPLPLLMTCHMAFSYLIFQSDSFAPFRGTWKACMVARALFFSRPLHPCHRWRMKNHFWWISMTRGPNKYQYASSFHSESFKHAPLGKEPTRERILIFFFPSIKVYQVKSNRREKWTKTKISLLCSRFAHIFSRALFSFLRLKPRSGCAIITQIYFSDRFRRIICLSK